MLERLRPQSIYLSERTYRITTGSRRVSSTRSWLGWQTFSKTCARMKISNNGFVFGWLTDTTWTWPYGRVMGLQYRNIVQEIIGECISNLLARPQCSRILYSSKRLRPKKETKKRLIFSLKCTVFILRTVFINGISDGWIFLKSIFRS